MIKLNARHIWIVLKKEVKDLLRDKKTIITSIILPMLMFPLLNSLIGGGAQKFTKDINENVTVALTQSSNTEELKKLVRDEIIGGNRNIKLVDAGDPLKAMRDGQVRLVIDIEKGYAEKLKASKPFSIKIMYDKSKAKSEGSIGVFEEAVNKFNHKVIEDRITALGANKDILKPTDINEENVAEKEQHGNSMLAMLLPLLMTILLAVGGIPAATDLIAGEKERNTFEPLLTTKPSRMSIILGKYLAITLFSFVTVVASFLGIFLGYSINPSSLSMGQEGQIASFYVPPLALLIVLLTSITLGMTFAGIQTALSTYAKSFKEAQTYLSFLMMAAIVPSYATMFMQANDIPNYMYVVPILNTISAIKMVLGGVVDYSLLLIALLSSLLYVALTLLLAASLFNREKVLFRS